MISDIYQNNRGREINLIQIPENIDSTSIKINKIFRESSVNPLDDRRIERRERSTSRERKITISPRFRK